MSISSQITRLQNAKASIKVAIEEKWGQEIEATTTLSEFSAYVTSAATAQYSAGFSTGSSAGYASGYAAGSAAGGGGGGEVTPSPSAGAVETVMSQGQVDVYSGAVVGNMGISGSGIVRVFQNGVVSNCNVYSGNCTYSNNYYVYASNGRLELLGSGSSSGSGSAVDLVVHSGATVIAYGNSYLENVTVSSGGTLLLTYASTYSGYMGSVKVDWLESKAGAIVSDMANSSSVTADYAKTDGYTAITVTMAIAPQVKVTYVGGGAYYEVAGFDSTSITDWGGSGIDMTYLNGKYTAVDETAVLYKHVQSDLWLKRFTNYNSTYYGIGRTASQSLMEMYGDIVMYNSISISATTWNPANGMGSDTNVAVTSHADPSPGRWSIDNGATWRSWGDVVATGDAKGSLPEKTITFSSVAGYISPSSITARMKDRVNSFGVVYTIPFTVTVTGTGAASAQWSYDGGTTWVAAGSSANIPACVDVKITFNKVDVGGTKYSHDAVSVNAQVGSASLSVAYEESSSNSLTVNGTQNGTYDGTYTWDGSTTHGGQPVYVNESNSSYAIYYSPSMMQAWCIYSNAPNYDDMTYYVAYYLSSGGPTGTYYANDPGLAGTSAVVTQ